jgi:diguanylate cyclase (GGDEF)-like protein
MSDQPLPENRRVLVIDDNPAIHEDFRKILDPEPDSSDALAAMELALLGEPVTTTSRPRFEVHSAMQGQEGVGLVQQARAIGRPYAMAFVDMRMPPGWDGLETIQRLWAEDPDVQIVICSAHADYDWADVVATLGHADKLLVVKKPFEPIEVSQCASALTRKWHNEQILRRQVEVLEQVVTTRTEGLEAANRQLRHLATHDSLTGLPNRVLLDDRLSQAIARADRDKRPFAVMLLDLDRFKLVNDSFGHRAGDALLKEVAHRLVGSMRSGDTVARLGGDEFVLILSDASDHEVLDQVARRIVTALEPPVMISDVAIHASSSIGIAIYPRDGGSEETIVAHADSAMYCAKQRGRGQVQYFEPGMAGVMQDKVRLESELHEALATNQLELHYQPKVDTATGAVHGAEALIRWRHPVRGMVPPSEFIPLAEECGFISAIGDWVIHEACRQARAWQLAGLPSLRIAVNVSPSQFRGGNLAHLVASALQKADLDPRFLEIELTETAVMTNPEESIPILETLSRMGVLVSVDDFGTGYSSMSYLRRLPIDKLKIDRSFINEVMSRPDDASIVRAIISLAHSLRLKVVAEGVETSEQLGFLQALGCDQYQGFHFSAAVDATQFAELVRHSRDTESRFMDSDAIRTHSKLATFRRR